jgi:hypothetical protein
MPRREYLPPEAKLQRRAQNRDKIPTRREKGLTVFLSDGTGFLFQRAFESDSRNAFSGNNRPGLVVRAISRCRTTFSVGIPSSRLSEFTS